MTQIRSLDEYCIALVKLKLRMLRVAVSNWSSDLCVMKLPRLGLRVRIYITLPFAKIARFQLKNILHNSTPSGLALSFVKQNRVSSLDRVFFTVMRFTADCDEYLVKKCRETCSK